MPVQQIRKTYKRRVLLYISSLGQPAAPTRGVVSFTEAAKLPLRIVWLLPRITVADLIYQAFEF